jgi:DNA-binding NtrC family response regulator
VLRHLWPGNVRELRNVMEQCALMAADETIEAATLPLAPNPQEFDPSAPESSHADPLSARSNGGRIAEVERGLIVAALDNAAGNVTRAAEALGITRDTLRYRMDKYKLRAPH